MGKKRIAYFYDADVGDFYYNSGHPMKPHRLAMTHALILGYNLHENMEIYKPRRATEAEMTKFHSEDYVHFLKRVAPDFLIGPNANGQGSSQDLKEMFQKYLTDDCPVFDGLYNYCSIYTGGSIEGAARLNHGLCDIAINWSGGLHHAHRAEAAGFCYINDLVLGILELLKFHARVLYIDIDIHHGDGVEEAFYLSDRVMTVSFHKHGDGFFPGSGDIKDTGSKLGRNYAVNVPLKDGMDDAQYRRIFKPIIAKVMEHFQPGAIVLQCGADSLSADRLGCFNLSLDGHSECVSYMKSFNIPLLVTGGGGYTKTNVARAWAYETAVLCEADHVNAYSSLPRNDYFEYFSPNYTISINQNPAIDNLNSKAYLSSIKQQVIENIRRLDHAPGIQFSEIPPNINVTKELFHINILDLES